MADRHCWPTQRLREEPVLASMFFWPTARSENKGFLAGLCGRNDSICHLGEQDVKPVGAPSDSLPFPPVLLCSEES